MRNDMQHSLLKFVISVMVFVVHITRSLAEKQPHFIYRPTYMHTIQVFLCIPQESIVSKYLTTLDRKNSVVEISRLDGISGKDICLVLMTKFLGKSGNCVYLYSIYRILVVLLECLCAVQGIFFMWLIFHSEAKMLQLHPLKFLLQYESYGKQPQTHKY